MNRYESYKDSGIPWLGEVPAHWTLGNLMYFISCSSGDALPSVLIHKNESNDINIPVIGGNGLFGYTDNSNFTENCLAIGRVGALCGNVHYINYPSWINDNALIVKLRTDKIYLTFLDYFFQSRNLNELASKTAQPLLTGMQVKKEKIAIPPLPEQTAIADYLDNKLGEIDALISKQEALLEKLAEQRTTIITHAVTKGLNAHAPMKNSGVAWLGDVPEHWDKIAIHYLVNLKSGNTITSLDLIENGEYPVFGGGGFRGHIDKFTHNGEYNLIGRQGALCGNITFANGKFFATEHAVVATPLKNLNAKWLYYLLVTMNLNQYSTSSAQPGISAEVIGRLRVPLLPKQEQTAIANYLDEQTAKIDRLSDAVNQAIARLKEYRSALITQAVTGKIKVI